MSSLNLLMREKGSRESGTFYLLLLCLFYFIALLLCSSTK